MELLIFFLSLKVATVGWTEKDFRHPISVCTWINFSFWGRQLIKIYLEKRWEKSCWGQGRLGALMGCGFLETTAKSLQSLFMLAPRLWQVFLSSLESQWQMTTLCQDLGIGHSLKDRKCLSFYSALFHRGLNIQGNTLSLETPPIALLCDSNMACCQGALSAGGLG